MFYYDGDDEKIYNIFYSYSFAINHLQLMKKYAHKNIGNLLENIDDARNIIRYGYYTLAEYTDFIDHLIISNQIPQIKFY